MIHRVTRVAPLLLLLLLLLAACQRGAQPTPPDNTPDGQTSVETPSAEIPAGGDGGEAATSSETATPAATATAAPSPTPADPLASVDPSGQTLTLRHPFTDERAAALEALVTRFNESNEQNISIELVSAESDDAADESAQAELFFASAGELAMLQDAGTLAPLTPYLESSTWGLSADEQGALLQPLLAADATADGDVVSWPLARTVEVLVYNAELLQTLGYDAPPTTWEQFEEMACAATEAGNVGYELDYAISMDESGQFLPYLASWGVSPMTEEGDRFALESPDAIEAMQFLQGLYTKGCLVSGPTPDGSARNFGMGTHLFTTDSSARLPLYQQNVEAGYGGEWGVAPLPHTTPEPQLLLSGYSAALASGTPEAEVAGWLFLKWLSEPAQQTNWSNATGSVPVRGDVETLLTEQAGDVSTLDELLANSQPDPTLASDGMMHLLLDDAMAQIVEGADAEETLIDLTDEANILATPEP